MKHETYTCDKCRKQIDVDSGIIDSKELTIENVGDGKICINIEASMWDIHLRPCHLCKDCLISAINGGLFDG